MTTLYDIYFSGELVEGFDRATVAQNLGQLFKADEDTVARLLSGKPQRLKRGLDKAGALKYKKVLAAAGAKISIKSGDPVAPSAETTPAVASETPVIAAAASDDSEATPSSTPGQSHENEALKEISLAPAGSDVLRENERRVIEAADVDTSAIQLESPFLEPEPVAKEEALPPPDTSHLSTAAVGEDIPHLVDEREQLDPDISHIDLAPEGADFREVATAAENDAVVPNTDAIELAPEGSDVLAEEFRKTETAKAPDTSHIQLDRSLT